MLPFPSADHRMALPQHAFKHALGPLRKLSPVAAATHSIRGRAFWDFDNDGDLDVLIMNMNEPPSLLRNEYISGPSRGGNNWLKLKLIGTKSNRSAIGARVRLKAGGRLQAQELSSQSSYYSCNDARLHFGLGSNKKADEVEIRWPNGQTEIIKDIPPNQIVMIKEGSGIIKQQAAPKQK